jgi:hypothetical protein
MFQRNILPPPSGLKSKPSKKPAEAGEKLSLLSSSGMLGSHLTTWHFKPGDLTLHYFIYLHALILTLNFQCG